MEKSQDRGLLLFGWMFSLLHNMNPARIGRDPDAERDWGQEEKGTIEDEMAGCHHQLDAHEFG